MMFLKIGTRIISLEHIVSAESGTHGTDGADYVMISLVNSRTVYFYQEEAEVIRKFLESHYRTFDLQNIYHPNPLVRDTQTHEDHPI